MLEGVGLPQRRGRRRLPRQQRQGPGSPARRWPRHRWPTGRRRQRRDRRRDARVVPARGSSGPQSGWRAGLRPVDHRRLHGLERARATSSIASRPPCAPAATRRREPVKVAVLGVGLIGGSIGLAARRRLGAEVVGFDPDAATLDRALELGALDRAAASARGGRRRAPRPSSAPRRSAPCRSSSPRRSQPPGPATVVTDVGSTKRALLEAVEGATARSASSAATRSRAPRPPGSRARARTSSRAPAGT